MSMYNYQCKTVLFLKLLNFYIGNWFMASELQKQTMTDVDPIKNIASEFHIYRLKRFEVLLNILWSFNQKNRTQKLRAF